MRVRKATAEDAEDACAVLRRSIEDLCVADHGGDPSAIQAWLANKTPESVLSWLGAPGQHMVVAEEEDGTIVGVGAATSAGEITLNYVSPDARFRGVSKAVLTALEAYVRDQGLARSTLSSTRTAHRFYRTAGYTDAGDPQTWGRLSCQPMAKTL
jgi:GNAT superfamily N-acetyltransferase